MTPAPAATNTAPMHATVELHATGRGTLRMNGKVRPIVAPDIETARHNVIDLVAQRAQEHGTPVILHAADPDGAFAVTVSVDGTVTESVDAPALQPDDDNHTAATRPTNDAGADNDNSRRSPVHLVAPLPPIQPRTMNGPSPMSASTPSPSNSNTATSARRRAARPFPPPSPAKQTRTIGLRAC